MKLPVEGHRAEFEVTVTPRDVDGFAALSGDRNPLHIDSGFAQERGFDDRVAHGALLVAFVSRMIGMHCPGQEALIHSIFLQFRQPVYAGDSIRVKALVDQVSRATSTIVVRVSIEKCATGIVCADGKVQVGLTNLGSQA